MSEDEDGFLSRWSRLKRRPGLRPEPDIEPEPKPEVTPVAGPEFALPAPQACPIPGVPEIDLSALPRIEELTENSDFGLFLRPGIPAALRGAALRRMWSLDPTIREFIGPADYAWDYNNPAGMPPGFSLDIGDKIKELLAQAIGERPDQKPSESALQVPDAEPAQVEPPAVLAKAAAAAVEDDAAAEAQPELDPGLPRRRHGGAMPA